MSDTSIWAALRHGSAASFLLLQRLLCHCSLFPSLRGRLPRSGQFTCKCIRCDGSKARAIDRTLSYTPAGLDEGLEERYAALVLAEREQAEASARAAGTDYPHALLQLYRDIFDAFQGADFYWNYLLHQLRSMLLFMPAAFDGKRPPVSAAATKGKGGKGAKGASTSSSSSSSSGAPLSGEAEWLALVEHHLLTLRSNLLQPPLHSIKADTLAVMLRSCDHIGAAGVANAKRAQENLPALPNGPLRRRVVEIAQEWDEVYFDEPAFAKLYPDVCASMQQALLEAPASGSAAAASAAAAE